MPRGTMKIGEVARIARVTPRTLRHYDAIGLLSPSGRSNGDYRLYSPTDLARLHQIRLYGALGMPLDAIKSILDREDFDARAALREHRERLALQIEHTTTQIATLDRLLAGDADLPPEELFAGFEAEAWMREAEHRWGDTPAWETAQRRTSEYGDREFRAIRQEHDALLEDYRRALNDGTDPASPTATALAERYRIHIDRWYYPLSKAAHAALSELYTADERFKATYERIAPGLARFVARSIVANANR